MKARLLVACVLLVITLYFYQGKFTTLAGDNLYATPWQRWQRWGRGPSFLSSLYRTGQIFHCLDIRDEQCSRDQARLTQPRLASAATTKCPFYFKWIEKDLKPWNQSGISKWSLDSAGAAFRVFIVDGKLYVKHYYSCHHSRSMFTVWGFFMLLERFPGQISDVDILFNCADRPRVYNGFWSTPPIFGYSTSTDNQSLDIPFPDWSFWGWPDMGIDSWEEESDTIVQGAQQVPWRDRKPVAHWKGDPLSSTTRGYLQPCNSSRLIHLYSQNWKKESKHNFMNSHRSKQCNYRYKIYAEGNAWSASYKYIMACGSTLLNIDQEYHDFFTRGLVPWFHYVPVSREPDKMCSSLEQAVKWGNSHPDEAERVARNGQEFITNELNIDRIYDYMYHLLQRYAKLQRFKVAVPQDAEWVCPSSVKCIAYDFQRKQLEKFELPAPGKPCAMDF